MPLFRLYFISFTSPRLIATVFIFPIDGKSVGLFRMKILEHGVTFRSPRAPGDLTPEHSRQCNAEERPHDHHTCTDSHDGCASSEDVPSKGLSTAVRSISGTRRSPRLL